MTLTSFVVENFVNSINSMDSNASSSIKIGGLKSSLTSSSAPQKASIWVLHLIVFIIILIKAFIVYLGYNYIVPKLMFSMSQDPQKSMEKIEANFRRITFVEAIILSIFVSTLFSS